MLYSEEKPVAAYLDYRGVIKTSFTVSLGEELGWRGYLVPRLESLEPRRTVLPSGIPAAFAAGPALYRAASFSTKRLTSKSACWPMWSRPPSRYAVSDNGSSRLSER